MARLAAERALSSRPRLIIAAGFCGALDDGLKIGDIVMSPRIVTVDRLVASPEGKRTLARESGADAVDMESAAVEDICRDAGVSFLAVRAVSDTVDTALSPRLVKLLSGGAVSPVKAAAAAMRQPSLLREFRELACDTRIASQRLAEALIKILEKRCAPIPLLDLPTSSTSRSPS